MAIVRLKIDRLSIEELEFSQGERFITLEGEDDSANEDAVYLMIPDKGPAARKLAEILKAYLDRNFICEEGMWRPRRPEGAATRTFDDFQDRSEARKKWLHRFTNEDDWSPADWVLAIAGEVGELANILKKVRRHDFTLEQVRPQCLKEAADIITYCDLFMTCLGARTSDELYKKFDEVTARWAKKAEDAGYVEAANAVIQGQFADALALMDHSKEFLEAREHGPYCPALNTSPSGTYHGRVFGIYCGLMRGHEGDHEWTRTF